MMVHLLGCCNLSTMMAWWMGDCFCLNSCLRITKQHPMMIIIHALLICLVV
ncbi:hypothetical protein NC651_037050 [Populus alba x Populus x berolinensis]|nr:hypothetical protein NC651_037050 [Populus alba x Populus x berolinensis]